MKKLCVFLVIILISAYAFGNNYDIFRISDRQDFRNHRINLNIVESSPTNSLNSETDDWIYDERTVFAYDTSGNLIAKTYYKWDPEHNEWIGMEIYCSPACGGGH